MKSSYTKSLMEAGCDEAGRGCLAGPVFAAAVILPKNYSHKFLTDSKKLSEKKRLSLRIEIEKEALAYAIGIVDNNKIDEINILNASILAMHRALNNLTITPKFIIVDGNRFKKYKKINHEWIIKGDAKFFSIAAASVLAKTYRDEYMQKIGKKYPVYHWNKNKGYPTKQHKLAIKENGLSEFHRKTFKSSIINKQLSYKFED